MKGLGLVMVVFLCLTFFLPPCVIAKAQEENIFATELLATYSTDYSRSSEGRKENVRLATAKINGTIVRDGEVFSFNEVVGERTIENGYKESPVIEKGEYVIGIGGGVCQVSTTLYNAILRAGLRILKVSPHSLPVGYVPPSMDAMVSSATDFRFFNDSPYPITIKGEAKGGKLTFLIYGFKMITDGEEIKYTSKVVNNLPATYEEVFDEEAVLQEGEEFKILKRAKDGLVSECYKEVYYRGELVRKEIVRRDRYNPEQGVKLIRKPGGNEVEG